MFNPTVAITKKIIKNKKIKKFDFSQASSD